MELENFRQFKGHQSIDFSEGSVSKKAPCITVLYGENGRGKTGIFRALMFGLYGDHTLSQDEDTQKAELYLVNRHLLEETPDTVIKAYVQLEFSHKGTFYTLRREISAVKKKSGEVLEQKGEARLTAQDETGNTKAYEEPQEIGEHVTAILDPRVKEHFLFDGEKIERLTKSNPEQRREVSGGIRNLLNIDGLEKTISASEKLCRQLDQDVRRKSSGELHKIIQEINEKEDFIETKSEKLNALGVEISTLKKEKKKVDDELEKYKEIRGLVEERKKEEVKSDELEDSLKALSDECRQKTSRACFAMIKPFLNDVYKKLDSMRDKGEIPPVFRSEFIQLLLNRNRCICGRPLEEDTPPYTEVLNWIAKVPKTKDMDSALMLWKHLDSILREIPVRHKEAQNHLISYADTKNAYNRSQNRLEKIAEEIGSDERADAVHLQESRRKLEEEQIAKQVEQRSTQEKIDQARLALNDLERQREKLENDEAIKDTLVRRSQKARQVRDTLKDLFEVFKKEAAAVLGDYATQIMHKLLDEEGRKNLKGIIVKDDYSLQMIDQWDGQFLANISAGQRQVMSIAFITALAKAAAGDKMLEMPLFMDTPFGRLSQEHRNNLIREIPNLSSQWVLLATDTELRREEGEALLSEKRLGKFYRLYPQKDGTTKIEEQSLSNVPVILKTTLGGE
jgi:DNA sulfur modification protein DndD